MRERLLVAFGTLILVIIAVYGVPRAYLLGEAVQSIQHAEVEHSADLLQELLPEHARNEEVDDALLGRLIGDAERIEYIDVQGELVAAAGEALEGHRDDIRMERQLPDGGQVTVSRSGAFVEDRVTEAVMPVVFLGLALTLSAGIACVVMARLLSRPFLALAATARQLGRGRFDLDEQDYKLPEAQAIGNALSSSARQLKQLLEREREFAANASHQLRTPITALRLELEDLTYWPETSPEVAAELHHALGELDRLSSAVTELLDLARGQRMGETSAVSLQDLLQTCAARWTRQASESGRSIIVEVPEGLTGAIQVGPAAQIFDVLIENALNHGRGDLRLRAEDAGTHLRLSVADQGSRPEREDLFGRRVTQGGGEGIGLAVASDLATAAGGTLRLESGATTCFVLILPQSRDQIPVTAGISSGAE